LQCAAVCCSVLQCDVCVCVCVFVCVCLCVCVYVLCVRVFCVHACLFVHLCMNMCIRISRTSLLQCVVACCCMLQCVAVRYTDTQHNAKIQISREFVQNSRDTHKFANPQICKFKRSPQIRKFADWRDPHNFANFERFSNSQIRKFANSRDLHKYERSSQI